MFKRFWLKVRSIHVEISKRWFFLDRWTIFSANALIIYVTRSYFLQVSSVSVQMYSSAGSWIKILFNVFLKGIMNNNAVPFQCSFQQCFQKSALKNFTVIELKHLCWFLFTVKKISLVLQTNGMLYDST